MKAQITKKRKLNINVGTMPASARSTKHSKEDDILRDSYIKRVTGQKSDLRELSIK